MTAGLLLPATLGLACVLEGAELLLGALWLLGADGALEVAVTVLAAGAESEDASNGAAAASLGPATATSAVAVETMPDEIASTSTGASTADDRVAVTSGVGAE